jgi:pyrroloquinoline quinone biosynthesis protein B
MRVKVLGSAAGGGFPQWNCGCANCARLRTGRLKGRARTQTQLAISPAGGVWFLVGASPDLRQQLTADLDLAPPAGSRSTPIRAVLLTSADVDSALGLLHLREFQPFRVYSTSAVARVLNEENNLFRALERSRPRVQWESLPLDQPIPIFEPAADSQAGPLTCRALPLDGKFPDYMSDRLRRSLPEKEAVIGLEFEQNGKRLFYAPGLPDTNDWKSRVGQTNVALLDGSFWTDDELIKIRLAGSTARQMGHLPLSGENGLLDQLKSARDIRRILIHINNTNPALDEDSDAAHALHDAGYEIAYDGMEFTL